MRVVTVRDTALLLSPCDQAMEQLFHPVQMTGNRCMNRRVMGGEFDRAIDGQATTAVTFSAGTFYHAAKLDFDQAAGTSAGADRRIEPRDLPVAIAAECRHEGVVLAAEEFVKAAYAQAH